MPPAAKRKYRYEAKITSPPDGTEVAFGEPVTVVGQATKVYDDGDRNDVTSEIKWRHEAPHQYEGSGGSVTITFKSRKNTEVALYVGEEHDYARITLKVVCNAVKKDHSLDELALALMILTEGSTCEDAEQRAIGAAALNRWRKYPKFFGGAPGATLRQVLEKKVLKDGKERRQFAGTGDQLYTQNVDRPEHVRTTMEYADCMALKKSLSFARSLLRTSGEITPPGFSGAPYFFNQARDYPPDGQHSPRVHAKGGVWKHTFYGYDGGR